MKVLEKAVPFLVVFEIVRKFLLECVFDAWIWYLCLLLVRFAMHYLIFFVKLQIENIFREGLGAPGVFISRQVFYYTLDFIDIPGRPRDGD